LRDKETRQEGLSVFRNKHAVCCPYIAGGSWVILRDKTGRLVREIADGVGVKKVEIQIRRGRKGKACHSSSVVPLII
jgi:hypothetical protein